MGTLFALLLLALVLWWFVPAKKNALSWVGLVIFLLGLLPLALLTNFHPYMLLAVGQSLVTMPIAPLGLAVIVAGHRLAARQNL